MSEEIRSHIDYHEDPVAKRAAEIRHALVADLQKRGVKNASKIVLEECFNWAHKMKENHPDTYHQVRSYYGMVTTVHVPDTATRDDFPGEDSAFVFLENLRNKLLT